MKFVSYLDCLPPNNKNIEKGEILTRFSKGVSAAGDNVTLHRGHNLIDADVAMIVGWVHEGSKQRSVLGSNNNLIKSVPNFG
jgi:hypothetical protein